MDGLYASIFFLIFAVALAINAAILFKTGDKSLLPYRAQHSIANEDDVRRVGRISFNIALIIAAIAIVFIIILSR